MVTLTTLIHYMLIVILLTLHVSKCDIIWSEKMNSSSLVSAWNISSTGSLTSIPSGGGNCPLGLGYCWQFSTQSGSPITALYPTLIYTTGYINVQFKASYKVKRNGGPSNHGICKIQYTLTGQAINFQDIATYTNADNNDDIAFSWNSWIGADQNSNGIYVQISNELVSGNGIDCFFNEFSIEGTKVTAQPTSFFTSNIPTTAEPTTAIPTTAIPTTAIPTAPTTAIPTTSNPTTSNPTTSNPSTNTPTTAIPTTSNPSTTFPTSITPTTTNPTTAIPTAPTTAIPTSISPTTTNPTTAIPTAPTAPTGPTTTFPTSISPTTANPTTAIPTTIPPTTADPTTAIPTAPTTAIPTTISPTTTDPTTAIPTAPSTAIPTTVSPTTVNPSTSIPTTASPTIVTVTDDNNGQGEDEDIKTYPSGISGYAEKTQDWLNNDATQLQLLLICGGFAIMLILLLCCCYCYQCRKTKKLQKTLYSFNPEALQNERDKKKKVKNYGDIPYIDAADPDSSIGHNHNDEIVAPAHHEVIDAAPPDDDEANFRKPNPNNNVIPDDVENKLEESLSVDISNDDKIDEIGKPAPPPPSGPVPNDILKKHRSRAITLQNKNKVKNIERRTTYHHGINNANDKNDELEMQKISEVDKNKMRLQGIERVRTQSHVNVDDDDDDPPTPISNDQDNPLIAASDIENDYDDNNKDNKLKLGNQDSLKNIANKRLSKSGALTLANKRNNNDPALALLSENIDLNVSPSSIAMIESPSKHKQEIDKNKKENKQDMFDHVSSPSAKLLFADNNHNQPKKDKIEEENDPFSSIAAEFNALSHKIDDVQSDAPKKDEIKKQKSGNDVVLGLFDAEPQQSGNDIVLDIFNAEPIAPKKEEPVALKKKEEEKEEEEEKKKEEPPQHRGKQQEHDPFASLDMSPNDLFAVSASPPLQNNNHNDNNNNNNDEEEDKNKKQDKDAEAMGFVDNLMSANPEFGDNNNIFGIKDENENNVDAILNSAAATSHIVDFNKYANVADTVPVDYSKLTQIADVDQYKVVSVEETIIIDDGDGNIKQSVEQKINEDDNVETTELDNILRDNMQDPSDNVQVIAEDLKRMEAEMNMASPLDALISEANVNDNDSKPNQSVQSNNNNNNDDDDDPFGALTADPFGAFNASPLDSIMTQSQDKQDNDDNNNNNNNNELLTSPLDSIMAQSTDNNNNNDNDNDNDKGFNPISSPLDSIMTNAVISPSSGSSDESETPLVSNNEDELNRMMNSKPIGHQTIDIDSFMNSNNNSHPAMYNAVQNNNEIKEDIEDDDDDDDDDEESLGSEIIHDTPRTSAVVHEKLDPQIFGNDDDEESTSSDDAYSNGTDPNQY